MKESCTELLNALWGLHSLQLTFQVNFFRKIETAGCLAGIHRCSTSLRIVKSDTSHNDSKRPYP